MSLFGKFADLIERGFERLDRINWRPFRRVAVPVLFVLFAAAAGMYALGWWDFTFIERPDRTPAAVIDNEDTQSASPIDVPADTVDPADITEPADTAEPTDTAEPDDTDEPDTPDEPQVLPIALMSDLCAEGWYVTSRDYDPDLHRIAVLNVDLGAPEEYTVRERSAYIPTPTQEYDYGEITYEYVLGTEPRPSLEAYGGFLFVDSGTAVTVYDHFGNYIFNYNESLFFAYTRDRFGAPLLYVPATERVFNEDSTRYADIETKKYYALTRGGVVDTDYSAEVWSRGVNADLPVSYGQQTEPYVRSVIVNDVSFLSLRGILTGWTRTLWGFTAPDGEEPFTFGWYDPEKLAEEARLAAEERAKAEEEAKEKGEELPKKPKPSAKERFEAAKAAEEAWDRTASVAFNYSGSCACVANEKGQMWFIDRNGNELFETRDIRGFNSVGRPVVENLLLPQTNGIESLGFYYFDHGLVRVRRQIYDAGQFETYHMKRPEYDDDELIYENGEKFPIAAEYDIISYSNGMILLKKGTVENNDEKYGFMDYHGSWIVQPELDGAKPFVEGLAPICRGGKWGVIDTAGNIVIPLAYDSVQTTSSGMIVCHYEGGWTVFAKMSQQ